MRQARATASYTKLSVVVDANERLQREEEKLNELRNNKPLGVRLGESLMRSSNGRCPAAIVAWYEVRSISGPRRLIGAEGGQQ